MRKRIALPADGISFLFVFALKIISGSIVKTWTLLSEKA